MKFGNENASIFYYFRLWGLTMRIHVLSLVRVCCVCVSGTAAAAAALYIDAGLIDAP